MRGSDHLASWPQNSFKDWHRNYGYVLILSMSFPFGLPIGPLCASISAPLWLARFRAHFHHTWGLGLITAVEKILHLIVQKRLLMGFSVLFILLKVFQLKSFQEYGVYSNNLEKNSSSICRRSVLISGIDDKWHVTKNLVEKKLALSTRAIFQYANMW